MTPKEENNNTSQQVNNNNTSLNHLNFVNVTGYILNALVVFGLGTFGWANRPTNGELSDKYQTILTPTSWAFSIWGPIFILEFVWVLWQFLIPSQRNSPAVYATSYWYLGVCLAQVGWTVSFSFEIIWLSLIFMYGILTCLVGLHIPLQRYEKIWKGYFLWQFPFSLHLGWIIAASILNTSVVLVAYGASAMAQYAVAIASLVLVVLVTLLFLSRYPVDLTPPLVLVWALGGIYYELQNPMTSILTTFTTDQINSIQTGALAVLAVVLSLVVVKIVYVCLVQRKRSTTESTLPPPPTTASENDLEGGQAKTGLEPATEHASDENP